MVCQGAQGTNFFIVKSGTASITKDGVEVSRVASGGFIPTETTIPGGDPYGLPNRVASGGFLPTKNDDSRW